jgi:hypothetical protein
MRDFHRNDYSPAAIDIRTAWQTAWRMARLSGHHYDSPLAHAMTEKFGRDLMLVLFNAAKNAAWPSPTREQAQCDILNGVGIANRYRERPRFIGMVNALVVRLHSVGRLERDAANRITAILPAVDGSSSAYETLEAWEAADVAIREAHSRDRANAVQAGDMRLCSIIDFRARQWAERLDERRAAELIIPVDDSHTRPITARERQLLQLRAAAPLRPMGDVGRHSAGTVGLPLFEPCLL